MSRTNSMSRRRFVAGASGVLLASAVEDAGAKTVSGQRSRLAIDGGEKAVKLSPAAARRWGEVEQKRLEATLQQNSLFYWQGGKLGPQTRLLTERFQQVCPVKYVQTCSSGTAAIHIRHRHRGGRPRLQEDRHRPHAGR